MADRTARAFTLVELSKTVSKGFTLVELLVVITIIVVLLALLVPAMDKAMYAARMAVCGANLRGIGWAATSYTQENRRYYPDRRMTYQDIAMLSHPADDGASPVDDRKLPGGRLLNDWIPLNKMLNDPLADAIDIERSLPSSKLEIPYHLWWSLKWLNTPAPERGMYKVGDKFTFTTNTSSGQMTYSFDVLASDLDSINSLGTSSTAFSSHPDQESVMYNVRLQDEAEPGASATTTDRYTYSKWTARNTNKRRPPVDFNYVKGDMSVTRINGITWDEPAKGGRTVWVCWFRDTRIGPTFITNLPPN